GLDAGLEGWTIRIEQRFDSPFAGDLDQFCIEGWWNARWQAAANHQPAGLAQFAGNQFFQPRQLGLFDGGPGFVEFHRQAVAVGDGEIGAHLIADRRNGYLKTTALQELFEARA